MNGYFLLNGKMFMLMVYLDLCRTRLNYLLPTIVFGVFSSVFRFLCSDCRLVAEEFEGHFALISRLLQPFKDFQSYISLISKYLLNTIVGIFTSRCLLRSPFH